MKEFEEQFISSEDGNYQLWYAHNFNHEVDQKLPTLVFNYGLVCSNQHWQFQIDYFKKKHYPILIHNYRGHYQDGKIHDYSTITFENIAKDIELILSKEDREKIIVLGHSMGVNVTLEYAKNYPKRIQALILMNGTVMPVNSVMFNSNVMDLVHEPLKKLTHRFPKATNFLWKTSNANPLVRYIIHAQGFNKEETSKEFVKEYLAKIGELGPEIFYQLLDQMSHHDIASYLDDYSWPTLIIAGDKDAVIPIRLQILLDQHLPNSQLEIISKGSHVPQVDFPDQVNQIVEQFIQKV